MSHNILSQQQVSHLLEVTIEEHLSQIGLLVIHQRRIPDYYIRRECVALGTDSAVVRTWTPTRWVTNTGRVTITDPKMQQAAFLALQSIHDRIAHHPEQENYYQARDRLKRDLQQLVNHGVRRARIAELTEINNKTIRSSLEYLHGQPTYNAHCPWDLLDRIAAIDWTPHYSSDHLDDQQSAQPITEREIQRMRHKDRQSDAAERVQSRYIQHGDPCWRCGNPWANLQAQPPEFNSSELTLTCRICTRDSYVTLTAATT